jgi:hypothetical protein
MTSRHLASALLTMVNQATCSLTLPASRQPPIV